jgi:predicted transcriptional regulator
MNAPTNIQIINGPDGKPAFVVIPYDEYKATAERDLTPHAVVEKMILEDMTAARAWREHLGLTQTEVAERMGVSQSAYAQQENSTKLRKATREKIAAALGIDAGLLDV